MNQQLSHSFSNGSRQAIIQEGFSKFSGGNMPPYQGTGKFNNPVSFRPVSLQASDVKQTSAEKIRQLQSAHIQDESLL